MSSRVVEKPKDINLKVAMKDLLDVMDYIKARSVSANSDEPVLGLLTCSAVATVNIGVTGTDTNHVDGSLTMTGLPTVTSMGVAASIDAGYEGKMEATRGNTLQIAFANPACVKPEHFFRKGTLSVPDNGRWRWNSMPPGTGADR